MAKARCRDRVEASYSVQVNGNTDLTYTIAGGTEQLTLGEIVKARKKPD